MDTLIGMTAGTWWNLLRETRFAISPRYIPRATFLTLATIMNSRRQYLDTKTQGTDFSDIEIQPPVFILGHWRSGTTLLHSLLTVDERFAYPNLYQILNPYSFLTQEQALLERLAKMPAKARAMDNMSITPQSPGEEEFAISAMSLCSPLVGWSFPRMEEHYDRFLTLRDVSPQEFEAWQVAFLLFLKKLTYKYQRPLLLKSPTHTARIQVLLDLFPEARFVHIHRNPYRVFQSTKRLFEKGIPKGYLQQPRDGSIDKGIFRRYQVMYDAFFEERKLVPPGRYHEACFEDLEQDMIGQVAGVYDGLNLGGFQEVEPKLREYVASIADYQKTEHKPLPDQVRQRVAQEWRPCFEEWEYAT